MSSIESVYQIFHQLNNIPRASHHEEQVADYLCAFANRLGLSYQRDKQNCIVIRKEATPGYEAAEPIVLLNHCDMVAVGDAQFNPLKDPIKSYIKDGWMYAHGTSLGADNGIGLSMALAILEADDIQHPAIEVLTTTNEEDGMTGAAGLSPDFIKGRKVINLDSEDYDTITVGAAGALIQKAQWQCSSIVPPTNVSYYQLSISNGLGGHSGVDINKGRINAIKELCNILHQSDGIVVSIKGGVASASIPNSCTATVGLTSIQAHHLSEIITQTRSQWRCNYTSETAIQITLNQTQTPPHTFDITNCIHTLCHIPCGVIQMHPNIAGTVMTSNNIGLIDTTPDGLVSVSCHTRSFNDNEMRQQAASIAQTIRLSGGTSNILMDTPGWQENTNTEFIQTVVNTFQKVLGFTPKPVAMHFVLEAGYYVQKFPGIQIACIGPRIVEPHSVNERVELSTINNIWNVLIELLKTLR
ncbi:MAG: beta-Ala-His dipeptidase [Bacteroidales bacterium]|nr:beta-Ala-His dipeptidase [Candidatus Colimorpha onthohippi]